MNITLNGQDVKIVSRSRGWVTVEHGDGKQEKVRSSKLDIDNSADVGAQPLGSPLTSVHEMNPGVQPAPSAPQPTQETSNVKAKRKTSKPAKAAKPAKARPTKRATPKATKAPKVTRTPKVATVRTTTDGKEYEYKTYGKTAAGHTSYDNGDEVAKMLRGKDIDEVYAITAKHMLKAGDLKGDFAGCTTADGIERKLRAGLKESNAGRQRMTLGNRLRAALRANGK